MTVAEMRDTDASHSIVLEGVSWESYERLLEESGNQSNLHFTYDNGRLEIMAPSPFHESVKTVAARLIEMYAAEMDIPIHGLGSTTFKREDLAKGLEPDECYYLANAHLVHGKRSFDLTVDPPPDLALEVDYTSSSISRQSIYASLGVAEIWRYDGSGFIYLRRTREGIYTKAKKSLAFPDLPLAEFNRFIEIGKKKSQHEAVMALRAWLKGRR